MCTKSLNISQKIVSILLAISLTVTAIPKAHSWDELQYETGEFGGVRTYYNPSFGAFTKIFPDDGSKKAQDIADYGFFSLYIVCDTGEKIVRLQYLKFDTGIREWYSLALAPIQRAQVKFGTQKPISWNVSNSEWHDDGSRTAYKSIIFSNPTLFMKKLSSSGSVSLPINAERLDYKVKFITKGFKVYTSSFKKAGCD